MLTACDGGSGSSEAEQKRLEEVAAKLEHTTEQLQQVSEKLEEVASKLPPRHPPPPPPPAAGGPDPNDAAVELVAKKLVDAISCDDSGCTVEGAVLDSVLDQHELLVRSVRIVPTTKAGQQRGYKLYGIRPNSPAAALGFNNGDLVTAVDGKAMDSMQAAMLAWEALRATDAVEVAFERKGSPQSLNLRVAR
jgi:membrane-associated protease RseP (regulator of RpoE activity)